MNGVPLSDEERNRETIAFQNGKKAKHMHSSDRNGGAGSWPTHTLSKEVASAGDVVTVQSGLTGSGTGSKLTGGRFPAPQSPTPNEDSQEPQHVHPPAEIDEQRMNVLWFTLVSEILTLRHLYDKT